MYHAAIAQIKLNHRVKSKQCNALLSMQLLFKLLYNPEKSRDAVQNMKTEGSQSVGTSQGT